MKNAKVIYRGPPKKNSWAKWMVTRTLRQNKNNMVAVVGQTGSGKSYAVLSICEIMSKMSGVEFTEDNIVFNLPDLMKLINDEGKLKKGSCILFDEPQASISSKDFQSKANKVFNLLVSTFRHRNFTLFFATPFETLLDKSTRKLFHARFETKSINRDKNTCRLNPRFIEHTDYNSKVYRKQMIIQYKDIHGNTQHDKLNYWDVPLPSKEIIDKYEQKKTAFTSNLNKRIVEELQSFEDAGKSMTSQAGWVRKDGRKPLTEKQKQIMECLAEHKFAEAEQILGIKMSGIHAQKVRAINKGYTVEEFKRKDEE